MLTINHETWHLPVRGIFQLASWGCFSTGVRLSTLHYRKFNPLPPPPLFTLPPLGPKGNFTSPFVAASSTLVHSKAVSILCLSTGLKDFRRKKRAIPCAADIRGLFFLSKSGMSQMAVRWAGPCYNPCQYKSGQEQRDKKISDVTCFSRYGWLGGIWYRHRGFPQCLQSQEGVWSSFVWL